MYVLELAFHAPLVAAGISDAAGEVGVLLAVVHRVAVLVLDREFGVGQSVDGDVLEREVLHHSVELAPYARVGLIPSEDEGAELVFVDGAVGPAHREVAQGVALSVHRVDPCARVRVDRFPLDAAHVDVVVQPQREVGMGVEHLVDVSRQPGELLAREDIVGVRGGVVARLDGGDRLPVPPLLAFDPLVGEALVDGDRHRSADGQQVADERGEVVALYGDAGLEIARGDLGVALEHLQAEMDGLLLGGCDQVIDRQRAVGIARVVAFGVELAAGLVGRDGSRIDRRGVGIGAAHGFARHGVQSGKAFAVVVGDPEVVGFGRRSVGLVPVGGHHADLGKRPLECQRGVEGLGDGDVGRDEVGVAALVIDLRVEGIPGGDVREVRGVVVQVLGGALCHEVGPCHELVGIVRRQPELEDRGTVGVRGLCLRCDQQPAAVGRVDGNLVAQVVALPVHVCQTAAGTVRAGHGACRLQRLGGVETNADRLTVGIPSRQIRVLRATCRCQYGEPAHQDTVQLFHA